MDYDVICPAPENNGRDRASTTAPGSSSTQNSSVPNEKIGEILRVMGVPPSMVSEASVLWTATATKIAAMMPKPRQIAGNLTNMGITV